MNCTWDENKNQLNIRDHKLSFEVSQHVFDDPLHISRQDRIEDGEERWQTVGQIAGRYIVLVAHTYPGIEDVRIISARKASRKERRGYEEGTY
jgi:uncharacterized DUF497 family protein